MASLKTTDSIKEISSEIKEDEELLWQGKPQKASFVLSKSLILLPFALIWLAFDGTIITYMIPVFKTIPLPFTILICLFFAVHILPVWMWIYSVVALNRKHKLIEYAFTDKRIISRENGILQSYYYKNLRKVSVKVNAVDKIFKVGDITVSGRKSICLLDISSPYSVGTKLQEFIDAHEKERSQNSSRNNLEYESYIENYDGSNEGFDGFYDEKDYDSYDGENYREERNASYKDDEKEFYDDSKYKKQPTYDNEYESTSRSVRFTSRSMPQYSPKKTDEDDSLDSLISKIKK